MRRFTRRKTRRLRVKFNALRRALRWHRSKMRRDRERFGPWQHITIDRDIVARSQAWFVNVMRFRGAENSR